MMVLFLSGLRKSQGHLAHLKFVDFHFLYILINDRNDMTIGGIQKSYHKL